VLAEVKAHEDAAFKQFAGSFEEVEKSIKTLPEASQPAACAALSHARAAVDAGCEGFLTDTRFFNDSEEVIEALKPIYQTAESDSNAVENLVSGMFKERVARGKTLERIPQWDVFLDFNNFKTREAEDIQLESAYAAAGESLERAWPGKTDFLLEAYDLNKITEEITKDLKPIHGHAQAETALEKAVEAVATAAQKVTQAETSLLSKLERAFEFSAGKTRNMVLAGLGTAAAAAGAAHLLTHQEQAAASRPDPATPRQV
jgi:hypothetical protein